MDMHLVSCIGVDTEYAYLRSFLDHYLGLGIRAENFCLILNTENRHSDNLQHALQLLRHYGIAKPETWVETYTSESMWRKRREIQMRSVPNGHWVINADVDEFHEYPVPLSVLLTECESKGVNCVQGVFIDRLTVDGHLGHVKPDDNIWDAFPTQADVQCTIGGIGIHHNWYGTVKLMAFKSELLPARGGHFLVKSDRLVHYLFGRNIAGFPWIGQSWFRFRLPLRVHHFKWTASLPTTLKKRHAASGVSPAGAEYGKKMLDYVEANRGINLNDIPVRRAGLDRDIHWRRSIASLRHGFSLGWQALPIGASDVRKVSHDHKKPLTVRQRAFWTSRKSGDLTVRRNMNIRYAVNDLDLARR